MVTTSGWKNKKGTGDRSCKCGSWKNHWVKISKKTWPDQCCVKGCSKEATLGAHVYNPNEEKEWIVPMCDSCNNKDDKFDIDAHTTVIHASKDICP